MMSSNFYSKVLLFGEYGIIQESKGLSIPYNSYKGCLKMQTSLVNDAVLSNKSLHYFAQYLNDVGQENTSLNTLNLDQLAEDIAQGLYFDSSIPQGYGVGSSGALVAAIYAGYADTPIAQSTTDSAQIMALREIFSMMESFFHGKSSGLDPLNSYLSSPLLIHSHQHVEPMQLPAANENETGTIFLLDSGRQGQTAPMVKIFMQNMKDERFSTMLKNDFIQQTNACVESYIRRDVSGVFDHVKALSKTVLTHFKPMIPANIHDIWRKGLESNDYYLKLCGSGGGGYVLGFTRDIDRARKGLTDYSLEVVCNL